MKSSSLCLFAALTLSFSAMAQEVKLEWLRDYGQAYRKAMNEKKDLLIAVEDGKSVYKPTENVQKLLKEFVLLRIPVDYEVELKGTEGKIKLLDHEALVEFGKQTGIVIMDGKGEKQKGLVISVLPSSRWDRESEVLTMLNLPRGSLTQRTLIWAVRIHDEHPRSTESASVEGLMNHAENHSLVQCQRNFQHHNLGPATQFGGNREIVAESWPWNRFIVDAAIDIVDSWRHSSGHWNAVISPNAGFGYDMKYSGQKWFATGVFR